VKLATKQFIVSLVIFISSLYIGFSAVFASHNLNELKIIAEQECVYSQYNLEAIFFGGIGVRQGCKEAFLWFRKEAQQGNGASQHFLYMLCMQKPSNCS